MTERGHGPRGFARGRPGGAGIAEGPALDAPAAPPKPRVLAPRRAAEEGRRRTGGRRDG